VTHFKITHEFAADPKTYWKVFLDEKYNVALYDRIGVKERTVLDRSEDEKTVKWSVRIMPKRDLPGVIKKVVGGDLGYTEISTLYKDENWIDVKIEPSLMKERTKIKAKYTLEPLGDQRVRRTFEGDIHIDLPFVGKKVEAAILEDLQKSYDVAAKVTAEWLAKGGV
jgi:Protein of unknown function (DUF2505)